MTRIHLAGSHSRSSVKFLRSLHTDFHSSWASSCFVSELAGTWVRARSKADPEQSAKTGILRC